MSFQRVPSLFRIPEIPGLAPPDAIWRGKGSDEGFYAFEAGSAWGGHVIVRDGGFCPTLTVDGMKLSPVFTDINGCLFWRGSGCVYKSISVDFSQSPNSRPENGITRVCHFGD